jgi:hypothetical protein
LAAALCSVILLALFAAEVNASSRTVLPRRSRAAFAWRSASLFPGMPELGRWFAGCDRWRLLSVRRIEEKNAEEPHNPLKSA